MTPFRRQGSSLAAILSGLAALGSVQAAVVINEIMYNSIEPSATEVEYVELHNSGTAPVDVTGWYLLDDNSLHLRCYLTGTIPAGGYLVVPGYTARVAAKYPAATCLNPAQFDGDTNGDGTIDGWGLSNSGDDVRLFNASSVLLDFVPYRTLAPWPTTPDGQGPSLELMNPAFDNGNGNNWRASVGEGTPCARNDTYLEDAPPLVSDVARSIPLPTATDMVRVTARVTDDRGLTAVQLFLDIGNGFAPHSMFDDGLHGDGVAADTVFGADMIAPQPHGTRVRYYVSATDSSPQVSVSPAGAPADYYAYTVGHRPPRLLINEIVTRNQAGIVDEALQHEDWVELRNLEPVAVDVGGMFLADDLDRPRQWRIPAPSVLPPGGRLLAWCDNDAGQGPMHATFQLSGSGGVVALFDTVDLGNTPVHVLRFGPSAPDVAFGFLPETADAPEYIATPTPRASNDGATRFSPVVINEFLATSSTGLPDDWLEFYNRGTVAVDISGWRVSDDINPTNPYVFPPGTILPAGGYLSVEEAVLGFGFASEGNEVILLTASDPNSGQDYFDFGPQSTDVSQGRLPNGSAYWRFFTAPTRDGANACPAEPPALPPVTGLAVSRGAASLILLSWSPPFGVGSYDVVRGDPAALRASGGDFAAAMSACIENNGTDASAWEPTGPGDAFYLVRASSFRCDVGSYDDGTESGADSRDDEIASSAAACP